MAASTTFHFAQLTANKMRGLRERISALADRLTSLEETIK